LLELQEAEKQKRRENKKKSVGEEITMKK